MIEVVYSGEEHEEQDEVRIPKNIILQSDLKPYQSHHL